MKKFLFLFSAVILISIFITSCMGKNTEKEREDSIRQADSIATAEAAQAAEAARIDSLRQDSIAKEEEANRLSILDFCKWDSSDKVMVAKPEKEVIATLKKLGFDCIKTWKESVEYCGIEETETWYTYERENYGYNISVSLKDNVEITFPNKDLLNSFIDTALANRYKKAPKEYSEFYTYQGPNPECYWSGSDIKVEGNKVIITYRMEC